MLQKKAKTESNRPEQPEDLANTTSSIEDNPSEDSRSKQDTLVKKSDQSTTKKIFSTIPILRKIKVSDRILRFQELTKGRPVADSLFWVGGFWILLDETGWD